MEQNVDYKNEAKGNYIRSRPNSPLAEIFVDVDLKQGKEERNKIEQNDYQVKYENEITDSPDRTQYRRYSQEIFIDPNDLAISESVVSNSDISCCCRYKKCILIIVIAIAMAGFAISTIWYYGFRSR